MSRARSFPCVSAKKDYNWTFQKEKVKDKRVLELPLKSVKRPLKMTRSNDPEKVEALMESIAEIGLQNPIDVLEVDGEYYGFSGCHRFEACERLNLETIACRVRKATKAKLKMHYM